jgi:D-alanyl-D-alanine dipeptidase
MFSQKPYYFPYICTIFFVLSIKASLVEITKINPAFQLDIKYATTDNFTGKVVYVSSKCYLEDAVANALNKVQKDLNKMGLGLKIFDGYRPFSIQEKFWKIYPNERYVAKPERDKNGKPIKGSKHNRGAAVDLTLINLKTGKEVEMPSSFDEFSEKAHRDYSKMKSKIAAQNCKVLENVMKKHGFVGLSSEWWHFDYKQFENFPLQDVLIDQDILSCKGTL